MPTSGTQNNSANDSFYNLLNNYGLTSSVTGSNGGVNYNIATTPLYFVRSGYIGFSIGRLSYASRNADYWPSSAASNIWGNAGFGAYNLGFYATAVRPSNGPTARWGGFPLRCLAKRS